MHLNYVNNGNQLPLLKIKEEAPQPGDYSGNMASIRAELVELKWKKRLLIVFLLFLGLLVFQYIWYQNNPKFLFLPAENSNTEPIAAEPEPLIEEKFLKISEVLNFVIHELEKQGNFLKALEERKEKIDSVVEPKDNEQENVAYKKGIVTAQKANVRAWPTLQSKSVLTLKKGAEVLIDKELGEWCRIITPTGNRAWVAVKLLEIKANG